MNKTLKTALAIAALGAATIANALTIPSSGTVEVEETDFDGGFIGGEFEATIPDFDSFYTFCMEKREHLGLPGIYDYVLSNTVDSHADNLSAGTAYLYEKFVKGLLYERTLDSAHDLNAGLLQAAIWYLEDEVGAGFGGIVSNPFLDAAIAEFGSEAGAKADDTRGVVKVMNLTSGQEMYQDVLVYVPDSGATLALLGLGLAGLAIARRRR